MIIKDYAEIFPDFVTLACILITCLLTSVPCERRFSLQNRHHCASNRRGTITNVEYRLQIEYASKQPGYDLNATVVDAAQRSNAN